VKTKAAQEFDIFVRREVVKESGCKRLKSKCYDPSSAIKQCKVLCQRLIRYGVLKDEDV